MVSHETVPDALRDEMQFVFGVIVPLHEIARIAVLKISDRVMTTVEIWDRVATAFEDFQYWIVLVFCMFYVSIHSIQ